MPAVLLLGRVVRALTSVIHGGTVRAGSIGFALLVLAGVFVRFERMTSTWGRGIAKVWRFFRYCSALPIVFCIRCFQPFVLIRLGPLMSERLGHLAASTEVYCCEVDAGVHRRAVDLFWAKLPVANRQFLRMWKRALPVFGFVQALDYVNRFLPGGQAHVIPMRLECDRDEYRVTRRYAAHISFTSEELRQAREQAATLGIREQTPFVCVHSRDSAYLASVFPERDWSYHDFRDSHVRNFLPALQALTGRGFTIVRTGAVVAEPLKEERGIIDYASRHRSELLDCYLGAFCRFYLGDSCGFMALPMLFRRPVAVTNLIPLRNVPTWSSKDLFIPKHLWHAGKGRLLTFSERLHSNIFTFTRTQEYQEAGLDVRENSAEEILELALEMDCRLSGTYRETPEDLRLRQRFSALMKRTRLGDVNRALIATSFLRRHVDSLR